MSEWARREKDGKKACFPPGAESADAGREAAVFVDVSCGGWGGLACCCGWVLSDY